MANFSMPEAVSNPLCELDPDQFEVIIRHSKSKGIRLRRANILTLASLSWGDRSQ